MIDPQSLPMILLVSVSILMLGALISIAWGRRFPRIVDGCVGAGLVISLGALIFSAHALSDDDWKAKVWLRGWIWPASGEGALTVGVLQDRLGLLMSALTLLIGAVVVLNRGVIQSNPRRERVIGGAALGAAGVILSWLSATPWLSFIGIALAIFGGLAAQICHWDENPEAASAARFAWERFGGLALSIFGACGIAGSRAALVWGGGSRMSASGSGEPGDAIGMVFLLLGLVSQFGLFPLNGWSIRSFRGKTWSRVIVAQVFPAWAAFAVLFRLSASFENLPVAPAIAWFLLIAAILSLLCGLLQPQLKSALSTWASAGFTIASAALLLAGGRVGFSFLIGMSLGLISFAVVCGILPSKETDFDDGGQVQPKGIRLAIRVVGCCAIAAATGVPGFISTGGGVLWFESLISDQPWLAATAALALGLFATLGWKTFFELRTRRPLDQTPLISIALPLLVLLPSLGLLAGGMITGGALPGSSDEVLPSLIGAVFEASSQPSSAGPARDDAQFLAAAGLVLGVLAIGIVAAYWLHRKMSRSAKPLEDGDKTGYGKVYRFVTEGYRVDEAAMAGIRGMNWIGVGLRDWVDGVLWSRWIPLALAAPFRWMGALAYRMDQVISNATQRVVARVSEAPSRGLQFIQNGDVQWYLIFSLGSGFLILLYFLRT